MASIVNLLPCSGQLPPQAMSDVIAMSSVTGSAVRKVDDLENACAQQERELMARVHAADDDIAAALIRRGEVERALAQERREACAAAQRNLLNIKFEHQRAEWQAQRELKAEEQALNGAKIKLEKAKWQRDQAHRKATNFSKHAEMTLSIARSDVASSTRAGDWRVELARQDAISRKKGTADFQNFCVPTLNAMATRPGARREEACNAQRF
eukprot:TRINITY_DN58265_c0_g1_i1.p1 TRINITY_DN58265_c0_g1~~TRINITY_DN58265_c0_g1_i1.p1  ORF type:complete len:211 (-),score=48.96 TRINITY_DN58265_c0_g1_i1:148-780(-)